RAAPTLDDRVSVSASTLRTVALTLPGTASGYVAPAISRLLGAASDPEGPIAKVEFYNGATLLGAASSAPYAFSWPNVGAGSYALTAKAYDSAGGVRASTPINVTVSVSGSGVGFVRNADFALGNIPTALALADFNRDGK